MLEIDGSRGEGGGQVLRSALTLSMTTGTPVRITRIRTRRKKPGLMRQHLTSARAAAEISGGRLTGAHIGSTRVELHPGTVRSGSYHFAVGTAGSTMLVLQCVLPALLTAEGPSTLVLEGGTHNPMAPPFPFFERALLPLLRRMGPRIEARLIRPGFFPAGGGELRLDIEPVERLTGLELCRRGETQANQARALIAHLPRQIAERELKQVAHQLGWREDALVLEEAKSSKGPGNVLLLEVESEHVTEVFTGFGERGVRAETVAHHTIAALRRYLAADVAVGEFLADQLLVPLALAGSGTFTTLPLTDHATTQIDLIGRFLDLPIRVESLADQRVRVKIG